MTTYPNAWIVAPEELLNQPLRFDSPRTVINGKTPNGVLLISNKRCPACVAFEPYFTQAIEELQKKGIVSMVFEYAGDEMGMRAMQKIGIDATPTLVLVKNGMLTNTVLRGATKDVDKIVKFAS